MLKAELWSIDPAVSLLILGAYCLLFAIAAGQKWLDLSRFKQVFRQYRIGPEYARDGLAMLIPLAEAAVAVTLWIGPIRLWAVAGGIVLLLTYAGAMAKNLRDGRRYIDCGCSWGRRQPIAPWMLVRNVLLVIPLALAAIPWQLRPLQATDIVTILGGIAALVLLYVSMERLFSNANQSTQPMSTLS